MRARSARPGQASQAGFTLLEIMATVGLVALVLLPILTVRESATNKAWRASQMLQAVQHAEQLLARRARDVDPVDQEQGLIDEDPFYRYELTLENYDLATGLSEEEEEEQEQREDSIFADPPPDAGMLEEDDRDDPHKVRRFAIKILWPGIEEEQQDSELVLEGYIPRIWKDEPATRMLDENR